MPNNVLKVRVYPVLRRAVEEGAAHGMRRAFKHSDNPSHEQIVEHVVENVMMEICEWFDFDEAGGAAIEGDAPGTPSTHGNRATDEGT